MTTGLGRLAEAAYARVCLPVMDATLVDSKGPPPLPSPPARCADSLNSAVASNRAAASDASEPEALARYQRCTSWTLQSQILAARGHGHASMIAAPSALRTLVASAGTLAVV